MPPQSRPISPAVGALLCGGASRRMGTDKATVDVGGAPLYTRPAAALAATCASCVQVGGAPLPELGWPVLADRRTGAGPAAGIETALLAFPGAAVVVCAVDLPFVEPGLLGESLARLGEGHCAVVPRFDDRWHPLAAAYAPQVIPELSRWLDQGGGPLQAFLDRLDVLPLEGDALTAWGDPARLLCNVNDPADLRRARGWLTGPGDA